MCSANVGAHLGFTRRERFKTQTSAAHFDIESSGPRAPPAACHRAFTKKGGPALARAQSTMTSSQSLCGRRAAWTCVVAVALSGCRWFNFAGNLASDTHGDVSEPIERRSPTAELQAACTKQPAPRVSKVVRRQPYLQQVTSQSAIVGWVTGHVDAQRVEVTTPTGEVVAEASAAAAHAVVRRADDQQMWATIGDLLPDTTYCYQIVAAGEPLTERTGFRTAPRADSTRPVRILAFGDSGYGGADQRALAAQMMTVPFELAIHVGDIAYESGTIRELEDHAFSFYASWLRHVPIFPVAGDHEYRTDDARPFRDVFALPNNERWYSFDWGSIHLAALDTEQDLAEQARWLDRDLAQSTRPWKIVFLHKPPFSSGWHGSDRKVRAALTPIFEKHGVQLVLAGHDHDYERSRPQNGVTYVVTGGGGRGTRWVSASKHTAISSSVIHFLVIDVRPDRLIVHAIDGTGTEFDSHVIPAG